MYLDLELALHAVVVTVQCTLDSDRSDECIDFTMMCVFIFIFFLCLSSPWTVKVLGFSLTVTFLIGK